MTKILLIDDAAEIRAKIKQILTYEGYEVLDAENGERGIQLARERLPDIILCDIIMPGMNGYAVLSELRKQPVTATIPFIFLTAQTAGKNIRKGMTRGADDYLTKPFDIDDLLAAITAQLEKHIAVKQYMDALRINLSSILPHELWTPIADITAFSEFLTNEELLSEPGKIAKIGSIIHETSLRLQRLVENYFMYAQLKLLEYDPHGREQWPPDEIVDTRKFLTFLATHQAECMNRADDLVVDLIDAELRIAPKSLQEIVTELLDNACTFSEPGTPVHLITYVDGNQFVLRITDSGQGMTPEDIAAIGAPRAFHTEWDEPPAGGFGLRICQLLVQLHGGELSIRSEPRNGTTVTIKFRQHS